MDTTAPTLNVTHSWIEKVGTPYAFKLLLDPNDDVGIDKIQFRSKLNTTAAIPDSTPWNEWVWRRDEPLDIRFSCTSIVIEVRALDAAGNPSAIQRRTFASPFPLSTAPNLTPKFVADKVFPSSGPALDCRGLFGADFDGDGRDDILQVDRASGVIKVRKQLSDGSFSSNGFNVAADAVSDSAVGDFDHDGRPDIALVLNNALVVYHNDGPNGSNVLQFSVMSAAGLSTSGISTVTGVAAGDVTGEGKDDIIITGTGDDGAMGAITRIAVLIHNDTYHLDVSNNAAGFASTSAGQIKLGDVNGDGWMDAVMIDAANNQVLVFTNKGNGSFGGADDGDLNARPQGTLTGLSIGGAPAQAIAVGDVTGDGRADVVATVHGFVSLEGPGQDKDYLFWQLLDSRGAAALHASALFILGSGPVASSPTPFRSDVILQDLNGDRFPEAVIANTFEAGASATMGGLRGLRFTCQLDSANELSNLAFAAFPYATGAANPHRLAAARYQSSHADVLLASGENAEAVQFVFSSYTPSSKTYDLVTGATTDSDPNGTAGSNGIYTYDADVGGVISYSINYVNNSTTAITGGVVECLVPSNLSVESGDAGFTLVPSGSSKIIRWTQDVPAGSSGVKRFSVRVLSGVAGSVLAPNASFKRGTTTLATKAMPKVVLQEPLDLRMTVETTSDPSGLRAHVGETITYRLRVKNFASGPINNFKLGMSVPANTLLTSGTSPPTPVLAGPFPNYTSVTWNNLSLIGGAEVMLEVRVEVKGTVASGTIIKNGTATVTRSDGPKVVAPTANVRIDPPLEITLSSNKSLVQPGDTIRYSFAVKNWLTTAVTNGKVVDLLPKGVSLLTAAANDAVDSPSGNGNFIYSAGTWTASQLSTTTLPAFDRSTGIMTWVLGSVPAGAQRNIEFDVIVKQDIPTFANINGVSTTLEVQNASYNFVATSSTNARIFAGAAVGGTSTNALTATSDKLLSTKLAARRTVLSDPPLTPPGLTLFKSALGDGQTYIAGEPFTTVINDSAVTTNGLCDYKLSYANFGLGTARNVLIKDYVPTNMAFAGNIWKDGAPIVSLVGCHFYDAAGKEMPVIGAEGFTDTNGNGFYDVGEAYNDANHNKKYDGVTASLVRSMEFPAGDVAFAGAGSFVYRTKTTSNPGIIIVSNAGGLTGVKNGLDYTKVAGYHLTADNLHYPVNGSPKAVKVLVTGPAAFDFPYGVVKSRSEIVGTEIAQIAIPFALLGGSSLTMSGNKMTVTLPKGYLVPAAEVQDLTTPTPNSRAATIARNTSTGITTVTFPINDWKSGNALFNVQLDPATKSVLKGPNGQIKAPLRIEPTISGGYLKAGKVVSIGSITRLLGALPMRDNITAPAPALQAAPLALQAASAPAPVFADAKIFVGRCAPVAVKRGDTFGYTIFVGNLTDIPLGTGTIEMNVPPGCDFVSASFYKWNGLSGGDETGGTWQVAPKRSGTKVTWNIGSFFSREGGAVTLTVKVRDDFSGTRIDDNSCIFDVVNATGKTPGPLGIVVRSGNESTQSSDILSSAASGLGLQSSSTVTNTLVQNFTLQAASCTITTGGTDLLQLNNGVAVIQLGGGRVLTAGPPDKILASGTRLVKDDAMMRVAAGPGDSSGVQLTKLPTLAAGIIQPTNVLLANLHIAAASLVAAGGGNMVAAGGGNMVAAGGGNLVGNDGSSLTGPNGAKLVGNDGSTFTSISALVAAGGGNLITDGGSTMVAAGGLNMVAAGGGNMVAAGGGNLITDGGSTLVAAGAGNLISQDGGSMVAAGGLNLVAAGAGNMVAAGGLNLIANNK